MFKSSNFCHVASNNRNNVKAGLFVYRTTDDLATVTTSGYFNGALIDLKLHDLIIHEQYNPADNTNVTTNLLCVTERTLDNVGTTLVGKSDMSGYVKTDGSSVMTGPLQFGSGSIKSTGGLGGICITSLVYGDIFNITGTAAYPTSSFASYDLGNSMQSFKTVYTKNICGYGSPSSIKVPLVGSSNEVLALKSQVDDAANSGEQLYTTGVWYAKMYAATVVPTGVEYNGRNYADFSQVDGNNNPIIVIYEGQNGAWAQIATITPPANHNGYMTITSKIWDIVEQAGQQGGKVLWSHNNSTFTPYPLIISYENINVTGESTVAMPQNPTDNQIVNVKYVHDNAGRGGYDLFDRKWTDYELNNPAWRRGDNFQWIDGTEYTEAYNHLVDDANIYVWGLFWVTKKRHPSAGDTVWYGSTSTGTVISYDSANDTITISVDGTTSTQGYTQAEPYTSLPVIIETETIAGTTVQFYTANDGHKICTADQESNVAAIYAATGKAWYYIVDTTNHQFKLPRSKKNGYATSLGVYGNGMTLGLTNATLELGLTNSLLNYNHIYAVDNASGTNAGATITSGGSQADNYQALGITTDPTKSGMITTEIGQDDDQNKFLYFYLGE